MCARDTCAASAHGRCGERAWGRPNERTGMTRPKERKKKYKTNKQTIEIINVQYLLSHHLASASWWVRYRALRTPAPQPRAPIPPTRFNFFTHRRPVDLAAPPRPHPAAQLTQALHIFFPSWPYFFRMRKSKSSCWM